MNSDHLGSSDLTPESLSEADRKLIELAAKAAGRSIWWSGSVAVLSDFTPGVDQCSAWHPLADDGDALRLAVKLGIDVCIGSAADFDGGSTECIAFDGDEPGAQIVSDSQPHAADPYAATRRAIVRAAAEIGKRT